MANQLTPGGKLVEDARSDKRLREPMATFDSASLGKNPLGLGPLQTRTDIQRVVGDLTAPLKSRTSPGGARVRLGSTGAHFSQQAVDLEGFARPLYGIVPLVVGGGTFDGWDRVCAGLTTGTDPASDEYWGPVERDIDQRMVEQASIGLALAFCPEHTWEKIDEMARRRLVNWLTGIFDYEPGQNNWQFFRILVALGLERVGAAFPKDQVKRSLDRIDSYRRGEHWYTDGESGNIDYYIPMAFHTYGLFYAAAERSLGLGDPARAEQYRDRADGFAADFRHWFAPDGAAIPFGRSLTYRFAMSSFWGALAWADVESSVPWGEAKGHSLRNLRWWSDKAICESDGVLSVGYTYANRVLCESYNSPGSPYWSMKAFAGLAAPVDHPYWSEPELPSPKLETPVTLSDAGWVVARDDHQSVVLVAQPALAIEFPEQGAAKYRKFAYSSVFGFSGDIGDSFGSLVTDSTLAFTDVEGNRRVRLGVEAAGVEDAMAWSTWHPWPDVRVNTVCWAITGSIHGRLHQVTTGRSLKSVESGFAVGYTPGSDVLWTAGAPNDLRARLTTEHGTSALFDLPEYGTFRKGAVRSVAVNANLMRPNAATPTLYARLDAGTHRLGALVFASPVDPIPEARPSVPPSVLRMLDELVSRDQS